MRMSCNGCRVLRKGCSENCNIRPCLHWITTPDSQSNATLFLAKFYGRAGLINLINAGPDHLRPAIFRSLLYEACGRIVNPISGCVGLLWSGSWALCQNAVEAVLRGDPITQISSESVECNNCPPLKACDIRHVSKDQNSAGPGDLHRVRTRCRFKRSAVKPKPTQAWVGPVDESPHEDELNRSPSHESSLSHQSAPESLDTAETAAASAFYKAERDVALKGSDGADDGEIELELTLGSTQSQRESRGKAESQCQMMCDSHDGVCRMELGLDHPE